MTAKPNLKTNPGRLFKDPSQLTPYEEKIKGLLEQGLSTREITDALGGTSSYASIYSRIKVVREKIEAAKWSKKHA